MTRDIAGPGPRTKRFRFGWLVETGVGIAIYFLYDTLRDQAMGTASEALRHGKQVVDIERFFGLYQEHRIQQAFLPWHWFISFWNIYYGTIHFVMPVVALVAMYRKTPARYVRWRNALLFMLAFGLVGFWLYPLTPPRLMPAHYDFVDAASRFFNFGPQQRIKLNANGEPTAAARAAFGNLYAAMPSLHVGWSTWSALSLIPVCRRTWLKVLVGLYPFATIFAIVVTGNHWILDAIGGWVVLAMGYGASRLLEAGLARRRGSPAAPTGSPA
jgi:membrane-associated phospholipid phosphatase